MIHGHEKSGLAPGLRRGRRRSGEPRERRRATVGGGRGAKAGAKGNTSQTDTRRTPSRASVSPGLERVGTAARLNKEERFTALLHHVDIDLLRQAYLWLKREAAPGVDGVTWVEYGQGLEEKLEDLHGRVHRGATARCRRGADISRSRMDGSGRWASRHWRTRSSSVRMVEVLNAIYEEDFLGFSYGFPPGRSQHDAPRVKPVGGRLTDALAVGITRTRVDWILDADIRSFFDTVSHEWLIRFVEHRIGDRRMVRLIRKWLKVGVMEDGEVTPATVGTPQGAVISPLLADIYLHYVLDLWVRQWRHRHAQGNVIVVRYADDRVPRTH